MIRAGNTSNQQPLAMSRKTVETKSAGQIPYSLPSDLLKPGNVVSDIQAGTTVTKKSDSVEDLCKGVSRLSTDVKQPQQGSKKDKQSVELNENCPCCGQPATLLCTRCRAIRYCSRLCQKNDWPNHKKKGNCVSIEGRTVLVDLEDAEASQLPSGQYTFILKIQVALSNLHSPMIAYDEARSGLYLIQKENCKKKDLLDRTIRSCGLMGGAKAYFKAKLREDKKLIVYLDQRSDDLGW